MSSTTTEATSSLRHNSQLAVRLASGRQQHHDPQGAQHDSSSSQQQQQQQPPAEVRRRPQRPAIPRHPIPSMQEAFAESLAEVTSGSVALKPKLRVDTPQVRRDRLLDQDKSEPPPESLWRMRPAQKYHELRKLLAQTAFGVYLLLKGMANSDAQVVAILQGHIDEIDDFLKTAMEDLKLATQDLNTRLDYLKLPLGNLAAFEEMLEDREFRLRIVEGNVRIEHILSRTTTALNQTIDDVAEGIRSTKEFTAYLTSEENGTWRTTRPAQVAEIFEAMRGNADGWLNAFAGLEEKTNTLDLLISKLADMVTDMDRCAGEVSRRTRFTIQPFTLPELTGPTSEESQDSYDTTPPQSPTTELSPVPPRLSIRFSGLSDILAPTVFLNDNDGSRSPDDSQLSLALQYTPPAEPETSEQLLSDKIYAFPRPSHHTSESTQERSTAARTSSPASNGKGAESSSVRSSATVRDANSADKSTSKGKLGAGMANGGSSDSESADFVDAVESAASPTGARQEEEQETGELLFMLSPRTYSPQPSTSPLPSPRGSDTSKSTSSKEGRRSPHTQGGGASPQLGVPSRQNSLSPTSPQSGMSRSGSFSASRQASTPGSKPRGELQKQASIRERVAQRTTPPDAIHIPAINAPQHQRVDHAPPRTYEDQYGVASPESAHSSGSDRMVSIGIDEYTHETASAGYQNTPVGYDNSVPTYETIPEDYEDSPTSQGGYPIAYQASPADYRSSSAVRHYNPAVHEEISAPVRETGPMIREISPTGQETIPTTYYPNQPMANGSRNYSQPSIVPDLIPSPYSEQQFFRPVQASPFSPLQQRPHTAASQFPSRPYHSRGAPSTMGMSMVSGVTTMTKDSKGQTVKKKRSAFGWLKKAFTLDEEERMVYEQRRQAERQNVYYDARSPKFLDGKRIR